ncbi:MAG: hypothetical protein KGS48_02150, partial [Bacteroidetes bacterium]|nr:hypothetical protein [Bacteroidota bacterium]
PLIKSQCAQAGCHDAISHKEGVYMVDYNHIMQFVKAFQPANSKLIKVITTTQQDDRMPPAPASPLSTTQIDLIKKWINQGALNNGCNENYGNCDTLNITYANTVQKIMNDHCNGCHYKNSTVGGGFDFTTYANVKSSAQSGDLYGSIAYLPGYNKMPKGGSALSTCVQQKILAWIHAGMPQ